MRKHITHYVEKRTVHRVNLKPLLQPNETIQSVVWRLDRHEEFIAEQQHGDDEGIHHAIGPDLTISVLPDAPHRRVYRRVAQKVQMTPAANGLDVAIDPQARQSFIVAELGSVKLYYQAGKLIMTTEKMV